MSNIKIKKDDKYRILLTELLPYEVPMLFSNEGLYSIIKKGLYDKFFGRIKEIKQSKKYGIPFDYEIKKTTDSSRKLSIIHPINQYDFIDFYETYNSLILHLCNKSSFSLRYPAQVAKYYYSTEYIFDEDEHRNPEVETEPNVLDKETRLLKSYFTYKKYDLLYKFYSSYEYQRLEQRFSYLIEFDITKCFYNIYTHSITWAVKDKESAKKNSKKKAFENDFDKLMQRSNYNETNGIVVGPEISRIFAEIILQQVDLNVMNELNKQYPGIRYGVDYEIKRYIDNYYVFTNKTDVRDKIYRLFVKELEFYKLYINDSKTRRTESPFITNITVGKNEIKQYLYDYFSNIVVYRETEEEGKKQRFLTEIKSPYNKSRKFITNFQCIAKRNNLTYNLLSKEVIQHIKRLLTGILKEKRHHSDVILFQNFLLLILDIAFYAYSISTTVSSTYKISQIIVLLCKYLKDKDESLKHNIYSKISKESEFTMTIYSQKAKQNETNIEIINLIIALKMLKNGSYILSENKLRKYFNLQDGFENINYFQILSLLYYIGNASQYNGLKTEIEKEVIRRYEDNDPFSKADLTCLFFDYICCPFVSEKSKKAIMQKTKYSNSNLNDEIEKITDQKIWFMNWDDEIDLEVILKKKEFGSSY